MIMRDAISKLISLMKDEYVICANGFISRDAFNSKDRPRNFYMLGSMGQASSIGLGFAMVQPGKKVVVFDGDGNLLMNLGVLAMISEIRPKNFVHIVFDNECYNSTGGQPTISSNVDLARAAAGCGIKNTIRIGPDGDITSAFNDCLKKEGPSLILLKVECDPEEKLPRVNIAPTEIAERFRNG